MIDYQDSIYKVRFNLENGWRVTDISMTEYHTLRTNDAESIIALPENKCILLHYDKCFNKKVGKVGYYNPAILDIMQNEIDNFIMKDRLTKFTEE